VIRLLNDIFHQPSAIIWHS